MRGTLKIESAVGQSVEVALDSVCAVIADKDNASSASDIAVIVLFTSGHKVEIPMADRAAAENTIAEYQSRMGDYNA